MRFDPGRVVAITQTLPRPRLARTKGERRAAEGMAGHFEEAGLLVERGASPSLDDMWVIWFWELLIYFCIVPNCILIGTSGILRAGVTAAMLLGLGIAGWLTRRRSRASGRILNSQHVIGKTPHRGRPPLRIVLVTALSTWRDPWENRLLLLFEFMLFAPFLSVILIAPWVEEAIRSEPRALAGFLLSMWLSAIMMLTSIRWHPARPGPRDGRIGLAMLAELSACWPRGIGERVETWFVATPNVMALNALLREREREVKATMVVWLESPGYGPEVVIAGHGPGASLAETAARDLWIPHRRRRSIAWWLLLRIFVPTRSPRFIVQGARDGRPLEPATLAASAQLIIETALRWAKIHESEADQDETFARSSQKPG